MQPSSGGFWRSDSADDASNKQPIEAPKTTSVPQFPSAYDGYDLTEPTTHPTPTPIEQAPEVEVQWEASEYIQHDKDAGWFIILGAVAVILFGVALLFAQWTLAALVVAMTAAIVVYARRPPRVLHYRLGVRDFSVEQHDYRYSHFRAFGVAKDGPLHMVTLLPRKRFSPPVSMYFDEQDGEQIVDILGSHMPMQHIKPDFFDELVRKLRF